MNIKELFIFLSGLPATALVHPGVKADKLGGCLDTVGLPTPKAEVLAALEELVRGGVVMTPGGAPLELTELDPARLYVGGSAEGDGDGTLEAITESTFSFTTTAGAELYLLEGGKYCLENHHGVLRAYRYSEPWRDLAGDGLVLALIHEMERRATKCDEVVCAAPPPWRVRAESHGESLTFTVAKGTDDTPRSFAVYSSGPYIRVDAAVEDLPPREDFERWFATTDMWHVGAFRRLVDDSRYESLAVEAASRGFLHARYGVVL